MRVKTQSSRLWSQFIYHQPDRRWERPDHHFVDLYTPKETFLLCLEGVSSLSRSWEFNNLFSLHLINSMIKLRASSHHPVVDYFPTCTYCQGFIPSIVDDIKISIFSLSMVSLSMFLCNKSTKAGYVFKEISHWFSHWTILLLDEPLPNAWRLQVMQLTGHFCRLV